MIAKDKFELELQDLVLLGMVIALKIILGKISIGTEILKVGLGFIGSVLLGYLFGPLWGSVGGGISDLVSSVIFGNQGGFFIGFTVSAMIGVAIYGVFLYQRPVKVWRIVAATLLVTVIVNVLMNTLWMHLLYGMDFKVVLLQRIPKEMITPWAEMIVNYFILQAISRVKIKR